MSDHQTHTQDLDTAVIHADTDNYLEPQPMGKPGQSHNEPAPPNPGSHSQGEEAAGPSGMNPINGETGAGSASRKRIRSVEESLVRDIRIRLEEIRHEDCLKSASTQTEAPGVPPEAMTDFICAKRLRVKLVKLESRISFLEEMLALDLVPPGFKVEAVPTADLDEEEYQASFQALIRATEVHSMKLTVAALKRRHTAELLACTAQDQALERQVLNWADKLRVNELIMEATEQERAKLTKANFHRVEKAKARARFLAQKTDPGGAPPVDIGEEPAPPGTDSIPKKTRAKQQPEVKAGGEAAKPKPQRRPRETRRRRGNQGQDLREVLDRKRKS